MYKVTYSAPWFGAGFAVVLVVAGCIRGDPWSQIIRASTPNALNIWQSRLAGEFSAEDRRRISECFQEIRLKIMGDREIARAMDESPPKSSESIDDVLRRMVDGRPLREAMQLGYEYRLRRLKRELAGLEFAM